MFGGFIVATLFLSAPAGKSQQGGSFYKTFPSIIAVGVGPDYAISSSLIAQIQVGDRVVVFDRDHHLRAEGTLGGYTLKGTAGNGVKRYDLAILGLHPVSYTAPPHVNRCGVAVV